MKKYIIAGVSCVILFAISYQFLARPIEQFAISMLDDGNLLVFSIDPRSMVYEQLLYTVPFTLIPVFYLLIDHFGKVTSTRQKVLGVALMLLCGISAFILRLLTLKNALSYQISPEIKNTIGIHSLKFHIAILLGVAGGAVLAIYVFRGAHRRRQQAEAAN